MMSFGSMFKSSSANTVGAGSASSSSVCPIPSNCSAVWESERSNGTDWSAANLTSQDPPRFEAALAKNPPTAAKANSSSTSASGSGSGHDSQASEEAWAVELHSGRWQVDTAYSRPTEAGKQSGSASEGWLYGKNFSQLDGRLQDESPNPRSAAVRRRRWLRLKQDESQRSGNSSSYSYSPSTTIFEEFDDGASEIAESLAESIQTTMTSASGADPTKRKSSASYFGHRRAKHAPEWDINFRVHDSTLSAIASEIKQLEKQCEAMEAENKKEWKDMVKASLETQIQYFEKACSQLTAQIEKDVSKGLSHVSAMEDDLRTVTDKLDEKKRALYFPTSRISMGQAGVYLAMDEYWIEHTSGQFVLQLVPDRLKPYAEIVLRGDTAPVSDQANATQAHASGAGISLRLKVENFRLAGDKGKNVPKLHIENMHLQLALNASLSLYFDADMKQWSCASKDLKLEIISLKGPYGVTKSLAGLVLPLLTPMIRTQLLTLLPVELGLIMLSLPIPFNVRGHFSIQGGNLDVLSSPLHDSERVAESCQCTPLQVEMFYWMQKSVDRNPMIRTMSDFLAYVRRYSKFPEQWRVLNQLWAQMGRVYSHKVSCINELAEELTAEDTNRFLFLFPSLCRAAKEVEKKNFKIHFKLQQLDGQVNLNDIIDNVHKLLMRFIAEAAKLTTNTALQVAKLAMSQERSEAYHQFNLQLLDLVRRNLDFAQVNLRASLQTGSEKLWTLSLTDLLAQAPLNLELALGAELNLGHDSLVPYIVSIKPLLQGNLGIEIYHFKEASANPVAQVASADRDEEATPSKEENVIDDTEANSDTDVAEVSEQLDFSKSTCDIQLEAAARADEDGNDTNSEDDSLEGTSPPHDVSALSAALSADDETPDATVDPKQSIKARSVDAPEGLFAAVKRRREANLAKIKAVVTAGKEKTSQLISKSSSFRYPTSNENVASAEHSSNSPEALAAGNTDNISSAGRRRSSSGANYLKSTTTQLTSMARATIHAERLTNLNESIHKMGSTINSMSSGITTITRSRANTNKSPVNATTDDEVAPDSSSACQSSSFEEEIRSIMQSSSKVGDKNEEAQTRVRRRSIHNRMVHTSSIANETSPSVKTVPMVVKDSAKIASRDELECNISDRSNAESSTNRRKSIDSEASVHRSRVDSNGAENQNFVSDAATSEDDLIDTMLSLELVKPHIAMIMDRTVQASAGMELFTFSLGEEDSQSTKNGNSTNSQTMTEKDSSGTAQSQKIRCPIRIFTATPVKLSIQASKVDVFISLASLLRFLTAHVADLPKLKQFLEILMGGEVPLANLVVAKFVLQRLSNYLLAHGLEFFANLIARTAVHGKDIILQIETPSSVKEGESSYGLEDGRPYNLHSSNFLRDCAVVFNADISLDDVLKDCNDFTALMHSLADASIINNSNNKNNNNSC